jgi:hypothetical protein
MLARATTTDKDTAWAAVGTRNDDSPSYPRTLWDAWNAYAKRAGGYQAEILLSCVYYLVLGPSALVARLGGVRLLDLSRGERRSYWFERKPSNQTLAELEREF